MNGQCVFLDCRKLVRSATTCARSNTEEETRFNNKFFTGKTTIALENRSSARDLLNRLHSYPASSACSTPHCHPLNQRSQWALRFTASSSLSLPKIAPERNPESSGNPEPVSWRGLPLFDTVSDDINARLHELHNKLRFEQKPQISVGSIVYTGEFEQLFTPAAVKLAFQRLITYCPRLLEFPIWPNQSASSIKPVHFSHDVPKKADIQTHHVLLLLLQPRPSRTGRPTPILPPASLRNSSLHPKKHIQPSKMRAPHRCALQMLFVVLCF